MTIEQAKDIINRDTPTGSIAERLEALDVAYAVLGLDATMTEIYKWAEAKSDS